MADVLDINDSVELDVEDEGDREYSTYNLTFPNLKLSCRERFTP
jgi:hypothetical protein